MITRFLTNCKILICILLMLSLHVVGQQINDGKYTERYETGTIKIKGHYKQGVKHKNWFYYQPNGAIQKREYWKKGILLHIYAYNIKGRLESITDKNGKITYMPECNCR